MGMRVEYDRNACDAWFQCVQEWDAFQMNVVKGKADLEGGEEAEDGIIVREVPEADTENAKEAAKACPIDAIRVFEDGDEVDLGE